MSPLHIGGRSVFVLVAVSAIVGCGGGGGSGPGPLRTTAPAPSQLVSVPVVVTESLPLTSTVDTLSIQAAVAQSSPPPATLIALGTSAGDCTASASTLVCKGSVAAPVGHDAFTIQTLANGAVLSTGSLSFDVANPPPGPIAISNAMLLSLNGVIAKLQLTLSPNTLTVGTAAMTTVQVAALDASGATIVGTQSYNAPVTVSVLAPAAGATIPAIFSNLPASGVIGSVSAPAQTLPLAYNGLPAPSGVNLVASGLGITSPQVPLAFVGTPSPTPFVIPTITAPPTVMQPPTPIPGAVAISPNLIAFVGPEAPPVSFTACDAQAPALTTCVPGPASFTATVADPTLFAVTPAATADPATGLATFSLTPGARPGGPVTVTVTDAQGHTGTLTAYINQTSIIVQGRH